MDVTRLVQNIQYVLAPAVMISSCGLLLLGFQNKFSNLAGRFRLLNHEKRLLLMKGLREAPEEARLKNLIQQVDQLSRRSRFVKDSILLAYFGIICFAGSSALIFLNVFASYELMGWVMGVFGAGLISILASAILMMYETHLLYRVIQLEAQN
ncbi:MAG TPA: DUF2721 domain-containing protein [Candidatus Omnitrophota bacterium]|nr:DUF2721 domain-containing protein [Candidatus Omnitrophota bacterium]